MRKFLSTAAALLVMITCLLTAVDTMCFMHPFYSYEYKKGAQAEKIGMSDEGLMDATVTLLDYLQDKRDDILVSTEVNGTMREVYNERETKHMVDVKKLYQNAITARNLMAVAAAVILIALYFMNKNSYFTFLWDGWKNAALLMGLFVLFIAIWCIVDFNAFWTQFHQTFFDNDLWLLDPNTSIMINMFPESFFFDIVASIIIVLVIVCGLITWLLSFMKKKECLA